MIKEIQIKNFQSHKDSYLELDSGVNVIVGASDSGKTAVVRALRWLIYNRPLGDAFRSNWESQNTFVRVRFGFSDGPTFNVVRAVGKGGNTYELDGRLFEAVGTDVPAEVQKALQFNEVNLQFQLDQPFLLSQTAGEVARYFNRIANIDKIDTSLKVIQTKINSITQSINADENAIVRQKEDLEKFEYLDKAEVNLEVLEEMENNVQQRMRMRSTLSSIVKDIGFVQEQITQKEKETAGEKAVLSTLSLYKGLEESKLAKAKMYNLYEDIKAVQEKVEDLSTELSFEIPVNFALGLFDKILVIQKDKEQLNQLFNRTEDVVMEFDEQATILKGLEFEFAELMPDVCPLCGSKVEK